MCTKQEAQNLHVYHDAHAHHRELLIGQRVFILSPPPDLQWLLGTVIQHMGPVSYVVKVADSRLWRRHFNHIHKMPDSPHRTPPETVLESPDPVLPQSPDLPIVELPVPPDIPVLPDPLTCVFLLNNNQSLNQNHRGLPSLQQPPLHSVATPLGCVNPQRD